MKITKLGGVLDDGIQAINTARNWVKDRVGVDMSVTGLIPCEMLEIDCRIFYRQRRETAFYRLPEWPVHPDGDIVCECGCFKFHVYLDKIICHECNKESTYEGN